MFAIPYEGDYTLIGTTEMDYAGDLSTPEIAEPEIEYLLKQAVQKRKGQSGEATASRASRIAVWGAVPEGPVGEPGSSHGRRWVVEASRRRERIGSGKTRSRVGICSDCRK